VHRRAGFLYVDGRTQRDPGVGVVPRDPALVGDVEFDDRGVADGEHRAVEGLRDVHLELADYGHRERAGDVDVLVAGVVEHSRLPVLRHRLV
jgi:hypothetical protein